MERRRDEVLGAASRAVSGLDPRRSGSLSWRFERQRGGRSSVGRVRASQARSRGFESRRPLQPPCRGRSAATSREESWESSARPDSQPTGARGRGPQARAAPAPRPPAASPQRASARAVCVIGPKTCSSRARSAAPSTWWSRAASRAACASTAELRVAPGGSVKADVSAHTLVVAGEVIGDCQATERVEIEASGRLTGNIRAPRIVIAEGASVPRQRATCLPARAATRASQEGGMATRHGNYIGGEWVAAASARTFENRNPADTSELVGPLRRLRTGGRRARGRRGARGVPALEGPARPQARRDPLPRRRDPGPPQGGVLARHDARDGQGPRRDPRRRPGSDRHDVLHGGRGPPPVRPDDALRDARQVPDVGAPAGGHRRAHHALELPDGDSLLEDDAGPDPRQHRRRSSPRRTPRCPWSTCQGPRGGGTAEGRRQHGHGQRLARSGRR